MIALFKQVLTLRGVEYITLNKTLQIVEISTGAHRFAEQSGFKIGQDYDEVFPELIGIEAELDEILQGVRSHLKISAIARVKPDGSITYFDLYTLKLEDSTLAEGELILFLEDVSERMHLEQSLVQGSNEMGLLIDALHREQKRNEQLLANVLPTTIVERLKKAKPDLQQWDGIAEYYEDATVLFADLVGFTSLTNKLPPIELVNLLNQIFSSFDQLSDRYGLEKIKTIGDAYMVVGGVPNASENHTAAIAEMALEMQSALDCFNLKNQLSLKMRIGIHRGAVIAGVIGIKKFIYDLWGDTVNLASRMESHGIAGQIQVSVQVYEQLRLRFQFEERGIIDIKGKGPMQTYFLLAKNPL
jgi:class 3 adenylate cyclase